MGYKELKYLEMGGCERRRASLYKLGRDVLKNGTLSPLAFLPHPPIRGPWVGLLCDLNYPNTAFQTLTSCANSIL